MLSQVKDWIKTHKVPIGIFLMASIARLTYVVSVFDRSNFNRWMSEGIDTRANLFATGGQHHYAAAWGSVHIFLGLIYKLIYPLGLQEFRLEVVAVLSALLGAISTVLVYLIAKKLFPKNRIIIFLSTLTFFLYYPYIYFNAIIVSENFFMPVLIFIFYKLVTVTKFNRREGLIQGIAFGLLIALRPSMAILLPIYLIYLYQRHKPDRAKFLKEYFFDFVALIGFIIILISSLNYFFDKHNNFTITSNGGVNATLNWCQPRRVRYELENGENFWFSPPALQSKPKSTDINTDIHFSEQSYYYKLAIDCIKEHPERILGNVKNLKNLFDSRLYPDFDPVYFHLDLVNSWKVVQAVLIIGFIVFPFLNKKRGIYFVALLTILSQLLIIYLLNPGEERYLVPFFFILSIWGVKGLVDLFTKISTKLKINKLTKFDLKNFFSIKDKTKKRIIINWLILIIPILVITLIISMVFSSYRTNRLETYKQVTTSLQPRRYNISSPRLSDDDKKYLMGVAQSTVDRYFRIETEPVPEIWPHKFNGMDNTVFIGFRIDGQKKGSWSSSSNNLAQSVMQATDNTLIDYRFAGEITGENVDQLEIEIYILGDEIGYNNFYEPGIHGVRIKKNGKEAVFYNSVAIDNNWDIPTTFKRLCLKAGLPEECQQDPYVEKYYFPTIHFSTTRFSDEITTFYRSSKYKDDINLDSDITDSQKLAHSWIVNSFNGKDFNYIYYPSIDVYSQSNSLLRQLLSSKYIAEQAKENNDLREIHKQNIEYIFENFYYQDNAIGYMKEGQSADIGTSAFALMTLTNSPFYDDYNSQAMKIAEAILSLQNDDGSFNQSFVHNSTDPDSMSFFSGETILALIRYYNKTGEQKYKDAAIRAQDYYIKLYMDDLNDDFKPSFVPWHSMSLNEIYKVTEDRKYSDALFKITDQLLRIQNLNKFPTKDRYGQFYNPQINPYGNYSAVDGVSTEGLAYAYEIAKILDDDRKSQYKDSLEAAITNIYNLQFRAEDMYYIRDINIDKVEGGIRGTVTDNHLRIDSTQHSLDALIKAKSVL